LLNPSNKQNPPNPPPKSSQESHDHNLTKTPKILSFFPLHTTKSQNSQNPETNLPSNKKPLKKSKIFSIIHQDWSWRSYLYSESDKN